MPPAAGRTTFASILLYAILVGSYFTPATFSDEGTGSPVPVKFPLMAWDYADDLATMEAMRDCGVTSVAFVPIKALDLCAKNDLKAIVFDERLSGSDYAAAFRGADVVEHLPAIIKEVADHPAVMGYHLRDEPGVNQYAELAIGIEQVRKLAPGKWPYVNLLPGEGKSYDDYLNQFVETCKPTTLSYDRYSTLEANALHAGFWTNLAQMRDAAKKHDLPFWNIILTSTHWHYRDLTETDFRMQIYGSLVYGVEGIGFYKFYSGSLPILQAPDLGNFRAGPLDEFGEKTPAWYWLRNFNRQVHHLAPVLMKLRSDDVYHLGGAVPDRNHGPTETSLIKNIPNGEFVVGEFTHRENNLRYVMIVNRSMTKSQTCVPEYRTMPAGVNYVSPVTGEMKPHLAWAYSLAPGQGILLELK